MRDPSMRYKCGVCQVTVPIVLVRAHVARHPGRGGLEEEEWRSCAVSAQSEEVQAALAESDTTKLSSDTNKQSCVTEKGASLKSASEARKQPAEVSLTRPSEFLSAPTSHAFLDSELHSPTKSSMTPLTSASGRRKRPKKPSQGAVIDCIRKVRKVQLALERVGMTGKRIFYMAIADINTTWK